MWYGPLWTQDNMTEKGAIRKIRKSEHLPYEEKPEESGASPFRKDPTERKRKRCLLNYSWDGESKQRELFVTLLKNQNLRASTEGDGQ